MSMGLRPVGDVVEPIGEGGCEDCKTGRRLKLLGIANEVGYKRSAKTLEGTAAPLFIHLTP